LFLVKNAVKNKERADRLSALLFLNNFTSLQVINWGSGYISGITVLDSELFVVRYGPTRVSVYDTNNFTFAHNISITGSSHLWAIVASPRDNCLYISDDGLEVVHRYDLSNNVTTNWSVGGRCWGLSLTSTDKSDNVLVTVSDTRRIKEYTPDGYLDREISLDSSIVEPYHSVQLSSGRFVVSHGGWNGSLHRVCIVDSRRRIFEKYGEARASRVEQLNGPRHLAVDGRGNVLVADRYDNRVVLLSPSLTHLGYIEIPGHKLNKPYALHLDELNHRLYIGEWDTGRVFVLTV